MKTRFSVEITLFVRGFRDSKICPVALHNPTEIVGSSHFWKDDFSKTNQRLSTKSEKAGMKTKISI